MRLAVSFPEKYANNRTVCVYVWDACCVFFHIQKHPAANGLRRACVSVSGPPPPSEESLPIRQTLLSFSQELAAVVERGGTLICAVPHGRAISRQSPSHAGTWSSPRPLVCPHLKKQTEEKY